MRVMTSSSSKPCSHVNRMVYDFSALVSLILATSARFETLKPVISILSLAALLISFVNLSRSSVRRSGDFSSATKGRPLPMHRTSMSSRPIPWNASVFASVCSTNGSQTRLWMLSGYCCPVKLHDSQPPSRPRQARQGQRVCGMPRSNFR